MTSDQTALLRILSNLDQSMARMEQIIERAQTYDGWQAALEARASLQDHELQVRAALRRCRLGT